MREIIVLGAGKIGRVIAEWLAQSGDYSVTMTDNNPESFSHVPSHPHIRTHQLDVSDQDQLGALIKGKYAVISACPFHITQHVAAAAVQSKVHYLDLTEDTACTNVVHSLAQEAHCALIPQCGLAPGFVSIAAHALAKKFDELRNVHIRCGALPKYPANALKYNLTWSTDGLINEYCNPCTAIVEGQSAKVSPLEQLETFSIDGINYEAFNTSGGLGSLCDTLDGKVVNLNYRSIRYPGHRDIMKMLLQDLRLIERRTLLKNIFEASLPLTYQDVVLIFINVSGMKGGQLIQETYVNKIYSEEVHGTMRGAIQITTASSLCAVVDLLAAGKIPQQGLVLQEDINYDDFIGNRFGQYYAKGEAR